MKNNRDSKGRFAPGNTAGPGRPPGSRNKVTEELREQLLELLQENLPQLKEDLKSLDPGQRIKIFIDLAKTVLPTLKAIEVKEPEQKTYRISFKEPLPGE